MLCYKDRTFCQHYESCAMGNTCERALTEKVATGAERVKLPISQFAEIPDCFQGIEKCHTKEIEKL